MTTSSRFQTRSISPQQIDDCLRRARLERAEAFAGLGRGLWAALVGRRRQPTPRRRFSRTVPATRA